MSAGSRGGSVTVETAYRRCCSRGLTQYLPFELVDDALAQTKTVQRRLRDLPSRVEVYFVLALGMYPRLGYARVWGELTAGLEGLPVACPSEKALRDLRRRLGPVSPGRRRLRRDPGRHVMGLPVNAVTYGY